MAALTPIFVLIGGVGLGQIAALAVDGWRVPVLFGTLLVLDVVGAVYSFRAAHTSAYPRAWRIVGAARVVAVLAFFALLWFTQTGSWTGYWAGVALRTAMFVLLAAATFASRMSDTRGRGRWAFVAEVIMVVAAGAMLAWYFVAGPLLDSPLGGADVTRILVYTAGDLLVLAAVCVQLLGGSMPYWRHPTTPMVLGLVGLLVTDIAWNAVDVHGDVQDSLWYLGLGMAGASMLLTLAPMVGVAMGPGRGRLTGRPAWSERLTLVSLLAGAGLMIGVAIAQNDLFPWGGLTVGLLVMVGAVMVRLTLALRSTREQVVADALTGLANRTGLESAIAAGLRRGERMSLLLIDLDDFKLINDAYGHAAGDKVLVAFGHHLRASVRAADTCARIGGDEFAVLLIGAHSPEAVAQRVLSACAAGPVRLGDDTVTVHASIGLTDHRPGDTVMELMRRADLAMYAAKGAGTHSWMRHDPSMVDRRAQDAALADDLAGAAARDELVVHYQPIVDLPTGAPAGYEALVRWRHPERGMVPPLDFIPAAERTGLICDIGLHVLERACADMAEAPGCPYVSVNLSPRQLRTATLVHDVLAVVRRTGIAPDRLVLEVTESAIVDEQNSIATLHALREHGIRIAIDDFGTGYSSLHYLTRLPVDILKIDRSFVAELDGTATGAAIAEAVIRLAQVLRLTTIAEGIETAGQAGELLALGCHTGQGFLYAPPRPVEEALAVTARPAGTS